MYEIGYLTPKQREEITTLAKSTCLEDAMQDSQYLKSIIDQWIKKMSIHDQLLAISSDPDIYPDLLSFDPKTGKPWNFDD